MSFIKNCQMSIFGNYESIVPESDLVRNLADALKEYEFIPGTIDVGLFDSVRGEASIGKRIHMISENECWKINILMERIDFLYTYKESGKEYFRLEDVCDTLLGISECVFQVLEEVRGKRLALNCRVIQDLTDMDIVRLIPEDILGITHYKNNVQRQLMSFANTANVTFGDEKSEDSNVIFKADVDARENKRRLTAAYDINTLSENMQLRFVPKDLNAYAMAAREKINEMIKDFDSFMEK